MIDNGDGKAARAGNRHREGGAAGTAPMPSAALSGSRA